VTPTREEIAEAILAQIRLLLEPPYNIEIPTITREWKLWTDIPDQPAVVVVPMIEGRSFQRGLPLKHTRTYFLWVYAKGDGSILPEQRLNPILDALDKIFAPPAENAPPTAYTNTLGGLVYRAALAGATEIESGGWLTGQAVAQMNLEIVFA
jgi:hypothetical protein